MQVVRLFLPFTALSTVIGFVYMTRSVAENKSANATNSPKTRSETAYFLSNVIDQVIITA